jgi:hypothetical protein
MLASLAKLSFDEEEASELSSNHQKLKGANK